MKHVALNYDSMGDKLTRGSLCLPYVYTINQLINIITKTLNRHQFFLLKFKINVEAPSCIDILRKIDSHYDSQAQLMPLVMVPYSHASLYDLDCIISCYFHSPMNQDDFFFHLSCMPNGILL